MAALLGGVACSKQAKPDATASTASTATEPVSGSKFQPDDAQKATLAKLVASVNRNNWRFASRDTNEPSNARLFTYLAATSEDPVIVGAALSSMYGAYSSSSKRKVQPDADFVSAVEKHIQTKDPKLAMRALLAARTAISGKDGNQELIAQVVKLAAQDPYKSGPGRFAIIDTLRVVSSNNRNEAVLAIFEESLESKDTYVLSFALQALYRAARSVKNPDVIKAKALTLAKHEDQGVRGRAIELLGAFGRDDPKVTELVMAALSDKSPYVRSEAAESIARLRYDPAVHTLIGMVNDTENNRYEIRDWTTLDDKPGRLHHDGSPWSHVNDAAMNAIRSLSAGALELERIEPKEVDKGLTRNAELTKAWYEKEKSKIPTSASASAEAAKATPTGSAKPKLTPKPRASGAPASSAP